MSRALETFLIADPEERPNLLKDPATRAAVESWMGGAAFAEYLGQNSDEEHLGAGPKNILFVPGVMGSTLQSNGLGGVWWLDMVRARDKLDHLRLNAAGDSDMDEEAEIVAGAVDLSYEPLRRAIATSDSFGGSVHFPYDWRKSLNTSVDAMRDQILKTHAAYQEPVHLVSHSMGGLMIRSTLKAHGGELWPKIGKIVYIATPHYGSPSMAGYLKNHLWGWEHLAIIGMFLSRETFRSMRGALSLLPAPAGIYPGTRTGESHPCANFDLYDASAWKLDLEQQQLVHLASVLTEIRSFHTGLHEWHSGLSQEKKDRMLMVVGVGQQGLFRLEFDTAAWGLWKRTKRILDRQPCSLHFEGDGRVPVASAELEGVTCRYARGEHGALPNLPSVIQDVLAWLDEGELHLPASCREALAGHLAGGEEVSPTPRIDGSHPEDRFRDLPEYEDPSPEFRAKIQEELEAGRRPGINLTKLF